jgi:metal-dependent amidase/aminoacylase/carboxypeptidase family protein
MHLKIYNNPEILFQEFKACKLLSDWFEARGWTVQRGVYGIETSFEARFSVAEGGRTVCFNAEYGKEAIALKALLEEHHL